jgi:DNA polymerase-3 subunit delta
MSITERALRRSIRDGSLERVYYFVGDDDFQKDAVARDLVASVLDPATRDFNHEVLRGAETSAERLDTILATPPMFAAHRVVVVREAHALKKDARAALTRYAARPAADVVLLLIDAAGEKEDKAIAQLATTVVFQPLASHRVPAWIIHHATTVLGVAVTEPAAQLLQDAVGSELTSLASELDKLASYTAGAPIDEDAVRDAVGVRRGETMADLLDAVADRDGGRAAWLVPVILAQPKANAVTIIMALATQMTAIAWGRAARDRGVPPAGIERGFYALLKEGRAYPGRAWKDAVSCWQRALPRWSGDDLALALDALLVADAAAKEARVSSEDQLVTSLVLSLCAGRARAAA